MVGSAWFGDGSSTVYGRGEVPSRLSQPWSAALRAVQASYSSGAQGHHGFHSRNIAAMMVEHMDHSSAIVIEVDSRCRVAGVEAARAVTDEPDQRGLLELGALRCGGGPAHVVADTTCLDAALASRPSIVLAEKIRDAVTCRREES